MIAISMAPYRSHSGPSGAKSQRSRKRLGQKKLKQGREKVEKTEKKVVFDSLTIFLTFVNIFDPGVEEALEPFFALFGRISVPKGPNDPCKGPRRSQDNDNVRAVFFPSFWAFGNLNATKKENSKMTNRHCITPPPSRPELRAPAIALASDHRPQSLGHKELGRTKKKNNWKRGKAPTPAPS